MANSLREVKIRISSTQSTAQITKAMYMVSQSKVKKAERTYKGYQDFMTGIANMVGEIVKKAGDDYNHPLITKRDINNTAFLLITSDRGLAGAYNSSLFKAFEEYICTNNIDLSKCKMAAIGKQGYAYLKRKNYNMLNSKSIFIRDDVMFVDILPLAKKLINLYLDKEIDRLVIIYNHYVNSLTQEIKFEELLPIVKPEGRDSGVDYIYETGIEKTLDLILPMYVQDIIYGIILDAKCAEHSARMNSMKNATDNAEEVIEKLQLLYNRARQDVITTELIDIIGGANAIGGNK